MAVQRRLAAILAADVAGYSRLMGEDEEGTLATLTAHLTELVEPCIAEHRGRVVKTTGDGLLAEFASVVDAVRCAVAFQGGMAERNVDTPEDRRIEFRIGVNLGDVMVQDDDVYGDGVNVAARLEGLAEPGGVVVSGSVHEQVRTKVDVGFEDLGPQKVKNITEPVHAFRARLKDGPPKLTQIEPVAALPLLDTPSIAVLPFDNLSGDPEQEYFSDGLTEDIITALSMCRSFPVIARNSTFTYKGRAAKVDEIATELGVRYVLEGSVRKTDKRLRINAQLIDAQTGHHVWAQRFDRQIDNIFVVQDEITERIAGIVAPELSKAELKRSVSKRPSSLDAWDCYVRGLSAVYEGTKEGNVRARDFLEQAIAIDPNFSKAYIGLSYLHSRDARLEFSATPKESIRMALDTARRAVALDNSDSEAYTALGRALVMDGQHEAAAVTARKGVEINPFDAEARLLRGGVLSTSGSPREGLSSLEEGLALNPRNTREYVWLTFMGLACVCMDDYERAVELARQALAQRPDYIEARAVATSGLGFLGRNDEAGELFNDADGADFGDFVARRPNWDSSTKDKMLDGLRKAGLPE